MKYFLLFSLFLFASCGVFSTMQQSLIDSQKQAIIAEVETKLTNAGMNPEEVQTIIRNLTSKIDALQLAAHNLAMEVECIITNYLIRKSGGGE